jgi:hypothetical protein
MRYELRRDSFDMLFFWGVGAVILTIFLVRHGLSDQLLVAIMVGGLLS